MILTILAYLLSAAAGAWALDRSSPRLAEGLVVGATFATIVQLVLDLVGLGAWALTATFVALLVPGVLGLLAWARALRRPSHTPSAFALWGAVAVTLLAAALLLWGPLTDWDSRMLWAHKAQLLVRDRSALADSFTDPYRLHVHPRYPLLVPVQVALGAVASGGWDELTYRLLLAAAGLATVAPMARLGGAGATLTWACTGAYFLAISRGSVEVFLVLAALVAACAARDWLERGERRDALRFGVLLAGAALVKNEGLVLALALGGSVLVSSAGRSARQRLELVGGLALAGALLVPWLLVRARIPQVSDEAYLQRLFDPSVLARGVRRLPEIAASYGALLGEWRHWHLVFWASPAVAVAALLSRDRLARALCLASLLYGAAVLLVFVASPFHSAAQHVQIAGGRVLLPVGALLVAAGWRLLAAWAPSPAPGPVPPGKPSADAPAA